MTIPSSYSILADHPGLGRIMIRLINQGRHADALYVIALLKTDLIELGHQAAASDWPKPGEPAPDGWPVYASALQWCQAALQR